MNNFNKAIVVAITAGFAVLYKYYSAMPPLPQLNETWWGAGEQKPENVDIVPFTINVSSKILEQLNTRLDSALESLTPPLSGVSFEYGFNSNTLRKIIHYWRYDYDWRTREKYLNSIPQFKTRVAGLTVHFLHAKPRLNEEDVRSYKILPILLLHGWPGSFREMYEIIPYLTSPMREESNRLVFELIIPSLCGFGFSEGASRPGLTTAHIGLIMKKLMGRLGFKKFYVHGGDWGSIIASEMATLYPESILGVHSNLCLANSPMNFIKAVIGSFTYPFLFSDPYTSTRIYPLSRYLSFLLQESGYLHQQATKPDTIGIALGDSPAGLAAYILEKFSTWTKASWISAPDGGLNLLEKPVSNLDGGHLIPLPNLLDNVMIYYISSSITSSMRIFSENLSPAHLNLKLDSIPVASVPVSCAQFAEEIFHTPEFAIRSKFPRLVRLSRYNRGGHFIAMEEPKLLAEDIYAGVELMEAEHES